MIDFTQIASYVLVAFVIWFGFYVIHHYLNILISTIKENSSKLDIFQVVVSCLLIVASWIMLLYVCVLAIK